MSIWADIHKRSSGTKASKEDTSLIYGKLDEPEALFSDEYRDGSYTIYTNGMYPFLKIFLKIRLSVFTGASIVKLKKDGKWFTLGRQYSDGETTFGYWFNKKDDYVHPGDEEISLDEPHDGHKYTLDELKEYAEMFIDLILDQHYDLDTYMK